MGWLVYTLYKKNMVYIYLYIYYLGSYKRDSKEVFELVVKMISNLKKKCSSNALDQLLCTMNRTILYQLSRSVDQLTGLFKTFFFALN
jgi:undecaprenyl pyrophosphate synthase